MRIRKETFNIDTLTPEHREELYNELFPVTGELFQGMTHEIFRTYFNPPENTTAIFQVFRAPEGHVLGFSIAKRTTMTALNREVTVFRAVAMIKREARGAGSTLMQGFKLALLWKLPHPFSEVYYFGSMLQPTSYYLMIKSAKEIWPRHDQETPPDRFAMLQAIADANDLPPLDPPRPYGRSLPVSVIENEEERNYWLTSDRPDARLFLENSPEYFGDHVLICFIPLTWSNLFRSFGMFAGDKFRCGSVR